MTQKTIRIEDYKYPYREEFEEVNKFFPKLTNFGFENKKDFELIFHSKFPFNEKRNKENLYWWDQCLNFKIRNLKFAYINTFVNYQRFAKENEVNNDELNVHRLQFDFYLETYFYFLFSLGDIVFQIINCFFNLDINEKYIKAEILTKKLENNPVANLIKNLIIDFTKNSEILEIRDSFTHRFPKNHNDFRATYDKDSKIYSIGIRKGLTPLELMDNVNKSIQVMDKFITDLKTHLK